MAQKGTSFEEFLPIIMCFNVTMVNLNKNFYATGVRGLFFYKKLFKRYEIDALILKESFLIKIDLDYKFMTYCKGRYLPE